MVMRLFTPLYSLMGRYMVYDLEFSLHDATEALHLTQTCYHLGEHRDVASCAFS